MTHLLERIALLWARFQAYLYYQIMLGETYQGRTWISTARRKDGADAQAQADDYNNLGYTLLEHDIQRNQRYQNVVSQYAKNRDVLDIGTGGLAFLSRMALSAGAKSIHAIDTSPVQLEHAKARVASHPKAKRIKFIQGYSTEVLKHNPKFDLIVHEIIGSVASDEGCVLALNDAKRFCHPNTQMVPQVAQTILQLSQPLGTPQDDILYRIVRKIARHLLPNYVEHTNAVGHYSVYNYPQNHLINTTILEDSRGTSGEHPVLDTCDFGSKHPIDEIQEHTYTLQIEDQTAQLSGVVLSLQIVCKKGETPLSSLKHKTNWAPIYIHLFSPCIVHKGEKVQVHTRAHLESATPRYEISLTTESGVSGQWAWSGCDA